MRIISGIARGRKILSPEGMETRPTLDRIKESMFSIIQNKIYGSTVADIFSGTGSLGLEAASRGAKIAYLVDKSPSAYSFIVKNIENLKFQKICTPLNMNAYSALEKFHNENIKLDIIFIDPPYLKDMIPKALEIIFQKELLKDDGIIVTKIDSSEIICDGFGNIVLYDKRVYGNTTVCLYKRGDN